MILTILPLEDYKKEVPSQLLWQMGAQNLDFPKLSQLIIIIINPNNTYRKRLSAAT
jgi:hypothetical protein